MSVTTRRPGTESLDARDIEAAHVKPEVQRRILEFLNAARRPQDLVGVDSVPIDPAVAEHVFAKRDSLGAYGYGHLKELAGVKGLSAATFTLLCHAFGPAAYGEWKLTYPTQLADGTAYHVAHCAVLHTGRVLFLPESNTKTTLLWDPADEVNPQFEFLVDQPDEMLFCTGHAFLSDGRLIACGGGGGGPSGVDRAWKFDPVAKTWTRTSGNMTQARWYPTVLRLGDDHRMLVVGGAPSISTSEVYDELTDTFTAITGPHSTRSFPQLYPGLHLLPGGAIFYSRTGWGTAGQGPGGGDPTTTNAYFQFTGVSTGDWVELGSQMEYPDRVRGMSVLLLRRCHPTARVLVVGGTAVPGAETAESIDVSTLVPSWDMPMIIPGSSSRINVSAVLLPDGKVLAVGGTTTPTPPSALYDPDRDMWSPLASVNYRKQYHSVAVLLPSGKVAATGGSNYGGGSNVIEIFSPPYLFKPDGTPAERPVITHIPANVHYGQVFDLKTPHGDHIRKVVFVWPMAVTHQTDTGQRVVEADFHRAGNTLKVTAPDGHGAGGPHIHGAAPRGYYMVFIVNAAGVPSEAKFVLLN